MKNIVIILLTANCLLISAFSSAQAPEIEWQQTAGGISSDQLGSMTELLSGEIIAGGITYSGISGNKTAPLKGLADYWVVKLNAEGDMIWDKSFGGSSYDYLMYLASTTDGGFIAAGSSDSQISDDKSEEPMGLFDVWIIKCDASGNIEWENTIGGTGNESANTILQTIDGGFIAGGYSRSGISGDKTEAGNGGSDYWVVKLDAGGNIEWDATFGGTMDEGITSISPTPDGGYMLGGSSGSDISADKSENIIGDWDIWIVKINSEGEKEWDNTIGGTKEDRLNSIIPTSDNNYLIASLSESGSNFDKTENRIGGYDYWIIKMDQDGNIIWDKTIGGSASEFMKTAKETSEGDYILFGHSQSDISGNKTQNSLGGYDNWIVKIDVLGNVIWDKTEGGISGDYLHDGLITSGGNILAGGNTNSNVSGDVTIATHGESDFWIVMHEPEICPVPAGLFVDNIAITKATVNWNNSASADLYQVWYRATGTGTWTKKSSATNFKTLKLLTPETTYEYKVRTKCSDTEFGEFSSLDNFTTLPLRTGVISEELNVEIYPNPVLEEFTIEINSNNLQAEKIRISISNILGEEVLNKTFEMISGKLSEKIILNQPAGVYIIKIHAGEYQFEKKIMIG
ncbi:MAG: T9SS type A sorting domain-containing protein [Chitinophagales bacterium]|nr:T9SS type A sorting domain-containing protein [Chitinophagales bacterium]